MAWEDELPDVQLPKPVTKRSSSVSGKAPTVTILGASVENQCQACGKIVYEMEKTTAHNVVYHSTCFRCHRCQRILKATDFVTVNDQHYCSLRCTDALNAKSDTTAIVDLLIDNDDTNSMPRIGSLKHIFELQQDTKPTTSTVKPEQSVEQKKQPSVSDDVTLVQVTATKQSSTTTSSSSHEKLVVLHSDSHTEAKASKPNVTAHSSETSKTTEVRTQQKTIAVDIYIERDNTDRLPKIESIRHLFELKPDTKPATQPVKPKISVEQQKQPSVSDDVTLAHVTVTEQSSTPSVLQDKQAVIHSDNKSKSDVTKNLSEYPRTEVGARQRATNVEDQCSKQNNNQKKVANTAPLHMETAKPVAVIEVAAVSSKKNTENKASVANNNARKRKISYTRTIAAMFTVQESEVQKVVKRQQSAPTAASKPETKHFVPEKEVSKSSSPEQKATTDQQARSSVKNDKDMKHIPESISYKLGSVSNTNSNHHKTATTEQEKHSETVATEKKTQNEHSQNHYESGQKATQINTSRVRLDTDEESSASDGPNTAATNDDDDRPEVGITRNLLAQWRTIELAVSMQVTQTPSKNSYKNSASYREKPKVEDKVHNQEKSTADEKKSKTEDKAHQNSKVDDKVHEPQKEKQKVDDKKLNRENTKVDDMEHQKHLSHSDDDEEVFENKQNPQADAFIIPADAVKSARALFESLQTEADKQLVHQRKRSGVTKEYHWSVHGTSHVYSSQTSQTNMNRNKSASAKSLIPMNDSRDEIDFRPRANSSGESNDKPPEDITKSLVSKFQSLSNKATVNVNHHSSTAKSDDNIMPAANTTKKMVARFQQGEVEEVRRKLSSVSSDVGNSHIPAEVATVGLTKLSSSLKNTFEANNTQNDASTSDVATEKVATDITNEKIKAIGKEEHTEPVSSKEKKEAVNKKNKKDEATDAAEHQGTVIRDERKDLKQEITDDLLDLSGPPLIDTEPFEINRGQKKQTGRRRSSRSSSSSDDESGVTVSVGSLAENFHHHNNNNNYHNNIDLLLA